MCCRVTGWLLVVLLPFVGGSDPDGHSLTKFRLLRSEFRNDRQMQLTYSFDTLGRRMKLELERNLYVSPSSLVSERWSNGKVRERRLLSDETACLFTGVVRQAGSRAARAAFDLCSGMNGHFFSEEGHYVVRPVDGNSSSGPGGPHVVGRVRRSTATDSTVGVEEAAEVKSVARHRALVEVALVADSDMFQFYGEKTETYLLSLMNTVSSLFRDFSLGDVVDIALVRLIILEDDTVDLSVSSDAHSSLSKFCNWQSSMEQQAPSGHHPDISLLLTRKDICDQTRQDCDVLGLTDLRGACSETRNCAIVQDVGLTSSVAIAHEIGHLLGMRHDGDGNDCQSDSHNHIMATTLVDARGSHSRWSDCSREYLTAFLRSPSALCLMETQQGNPHQSLQTKGEVVKGKLPGEVFTLTEQCQIAHGQGARPCHMPGNATCGILWCSTPTRRCITYALPWADGTACGSGKWCMNRQCISRKTVAGKNAPVHGGWSQWTEFGHCSRTCGVGIRSAHRKCDSPSPRNGGRYCVGERHKHISCALSDCPSGSPSFRESQCAEFDHKAVQVKGRLWLTTWKPKPLTAKGQECRLLCYNSDKSVLVELAPVVKDGTPCGDNEEGICIRGNCLTTGCDHVLGSDKRLDQCGVCGGDGSSCEVVHGSYRPVSRGFSTVVEVPQGAAHIQVQQSSASYRDGCYLALQNGHGRYYFNSGFYIRTYPGLYHAAGTTVKYSGASSSQESITAPGPLHAKLVVKVLNFNPNPPEVRFSFSVPRGAGEIRNNTSELQRGSVQYSWVYDNEWSACSKLCEGVQIRRVICKDEETKKGVSDDYCRGSDKPVQHSRQCNTVCATRWVVQSVSHCSVSCGGGVSVRHVQCVQMPETREQKRVADEKCHSTRPDDSVSCNTEPCPTWKTLDWSDCSNKCGRGLEQRTVQCTVPSRDMAATGCDVRHKPVTTRACLDMSCPRWVVRNWSTCSHTCGGGHEKANIVCSSIAGQEILPLSCEGIPKPTTLRPCNAHKCPRWESSSWSKCSQVCGTGVETRNVSCLYNGHTVVSSYCGGLAKPAETRSCVLKVCTEWRASQWRQCPGRCTNGVQTRLIWCGDRQGKRRPFSDCDRSSQPIHLRPCKAMCPAWKAGLWNQCIVSCGGGLQKRSVQCVDSSSGRLLHTSTCSRATRPTVIQQCGISPCHTWHAGDWEQCSCNGVQERIVFCTDTNGKRVDDSACAGARRPSASQSCNHDQIGCPSARWLKTKWSACKGACGTGERWRDVYCVNDKGDTLLDSECHGRKPIEARSCTVKQLCEKWVTGRWSKCSTNCGPRVRRRRVNCVGIDGSPSKSCNIASKPADTKPCHVKC